MKLFRPTLRFRMALLYGGLVLGAGVALLIVSLIELTHTINQLPFFGTRGQLIIRDQTGAVTVVPPGDLSRIAHRSTNDFLWHTGLIYCGIVLLLGFAGGYLLAWQTLRPVAKLTRTARQLSTETLDQRIELGGPDDELRELADTFDGMLQRLDAAFESQRLFVANASHELRTPLSVIRTEVEVTLGDPNADVAELRRMGEVVEVAAVRAQHLITSLLALARLQAVDNAALEVREPVELTALARSVLTAVDAEAQERQISLRDDLAPAWADGDPRLLERLIGNLVENGIRHNVPSGWLRLRVAPGPTGSVIEVANSGAMVSDGDLQSLFEPFRRGGQPRTATRGAGLGLAIVRLICEAHHARLVISAQPDGGIRVRVELPPVDPVPQPSTGSPAVAPRALLT